jgi:hypothetical protein
VAITLTFGQPTGDHLVFGPLEAAEQPEYVAAPIELWIDGSVVVRLGDRNGIETRALACLRDDLRSLRRAGTGIVTFGDHDFPSMVTLEGRADGSVAVTVDVPSADRWDVVLEPMHRADIDALVAAVDAVEAAVGLDAWCSACGRPEPTYRPMGEDDWVRGFTGDEVATELARRRRLARWSWAIIGGGVAMCFGGFAIGAAPLGLLGALVAALELRVKPWQKRWNRCPACSAQLRSFAQPACDACNIRLRA